METPLIPPVQKDDYGRLLNISALLVIFSTAFLFFSYVTADPDLWGHLKFGMEHVKSGRLAATDPYSYTAFGYTWINHEWLCEAIFYLVYNMFSDAGLLYGKLLIGFLTLVILIMAVRLRPANPLILAIAGAFAVIGMSRGYLIRPQLFSFLFFSAFLYILIRHFEKGGWLIFILPLLMLAWVNLHGGFLMGWALLMVATFWETFSHLVLRRKKKDIATLWAVFIAVNLATLANPYGYKLHIFLYETLTFTPDITEWNRLNLFDSSYLQVKILMILFAACAILDRKNVRGWEFWAVAMTLLAAIKHERHTPFFSMTALPFVVYHASALAEKFAKKHPAFALTRPSKIAVAIVMTVAAAILAFRGATAYATTDSRIYVSFGRFPVQAVSFMEKNNIHGDIMVPFDWGEYVIWHLYPGSRVSVDGRFTTSYPRSVLDPQFLAPNDDAGYARLLKKFPPDIILARQIPFFQKMPMNKEPGWIYAYSDPGSIIFIRDSEKNREMLERLRAGKFTYSGIGREPFFP